jgi:hypothetical protein
MNALDTTRRESSYSGGMDDCVECRTDQNRVLLRDSRHPAHGQLTFPRHRVACPTGRRTLG